MSNQQPYGLHLKWLGVTCFEIKFGQTTAVTDPYITESPTSDLTWEGIEDCSIITSRYKIGDSMEGVIGLIGPTRMDYKKAVSVLKSTTDLLSKRMTEITDVQEE